MPKRKGEGIAHPEEPQTKHHHSEGVLLPEEIVVEIIGYLPLPQIFTLHILSKSMNNALKDPTQTLWKRLVKLHWEEESYTNNDHWNEVEEYGVASDKWDGPAPYSSVVGSFCWGKERPTAKDEERWIDEASNEKCRSLVQTWALIALWTATLSPSLLSRCPSQPRARDGSVYICRMPPTSSSNNSSKITTHTATTRALLTLLRAHLKTSTKALWRESRIISNANAREQNGGLWASERESKRKTMMTMKTMSPRYATFLRVPRRNGNSFQASSQKKGECQMGCDGESHHELAWWKHWPLRKYVQALLGPTKGQLRRGFHCHW